MECPTRQTLMAAVDESENSRRAVEYLSVWAACNEAVRVVLVHVIKEPSQDVHPDPEEREAYVKDAEEEARALLSRTRDTLESAGVPSSRIETRTLACEPPDTVVEAILEEKNRDDYDTIVLGRRGMSKREEYIFGSVTNRLVREVSDVSLWVVP